MKLLIERERTNVTDAAVSWRVDGAGTKQIVAEGVEAGHATVQLSMLPVHALTVRCADYGRSYVLHHLR